MAQQPTVGHGLLIVEASRSYSDTPHSVGFLWTSVKHLHRDFYLTTHKTDNRHIYVPRRGFEPAIQKKRVAPDPSLRPVILHRLAAAWYRALASITPGRDRFSWNLSFLVF